MRYTRDLDGYELEVTPEGSGEYRVDLFEGQLCVSSRNVVFENFLYDDGVDVLLHDTELIQELIEEAKAIS